MELLTKKIKFEYAPPLRKSLIIADEQICGFFIRKRPPDKDNPVLHFPESKEDTKVYATLCSYTTDKTLDSKIKINNDVIKKGETKWISMIRVTRSRTSGDLNLIGVKCYLSIVIGEIMFISNPFFLRTNQTQIEDRSILNVFDEPEPVPQQLTNRPKEKTVNNPRSAIHNSLLIIKSSLENIGNDVKYLKGKKLNIRIYVPNKNIIFKDLFSKLSETRGLFIVYDINLEHDMVLIQKDENIDFTTDKKIITETGLINLLNE